jgi:hypothetical protein
VVGGRDTRGRGRGEIYGDGIWTGAWTAGPGLLADAMPIRDVGGGGQVGQRGGRSVCVGAQRSGGGRFLGSGRSDLWSSCAAPGGIRAAPELS